MFSRRYIPASHSSWNLPIGPKAQDSRQYRSRSIAQLPSTTTTIQGLNIVNTSQLSKRLLHSNSGFRSSSLGVVSEVNPQPLPLVTASNPQLSAPLSAPSQDDFDWAFGQSRGEQASSPLLALDAAVSTPQEQTVQKPSAQTVAQLANMSAVAIQQYDSHFDAGMAGVRQSYTWPNFDMGINQQFFSPMSSPALSTTMTQFEEPKMMPVYARSLSSSPPRGSLTPEQRELKKQRDYARRDSKAKYRRERSTSNPYVVSQQPSPALLPGALPDFASSVSPSPLLSHATPVIPSTGYLGPFATAINDGTVPDLYAPVYSMGPNDFTSPAYAMPFADPITSLQPQSFIPRVPSATEQQLFHPQPQLHLTPKLDSADHVRVVHSRPKPQCWEHGCNGRQFSTFSNLLRHQREKSGVAAKSSCPNCGAEFTRTTARNGHMAHEKCKQRRNS